MDKKTKILAHRPLDKEIKQMEELAEGFDKIARGTEAFAPRDFYQGKRLAAKDWKKKKARRKMQNRSRKTARS
jgi:hypothetical protein